MMLQRGDFTVLHEPFSRVTDFGDTTVAERMVRSERELIEAIRRLASERPVFFKDTTDFRYPGLLADKTFLREATHTFMIRDPGAVIASHYRLNPELTRDEIGFGRLEEIFRVVVEATGKEPVVIDADELVDKPTAVVAEYCRQVEIPYLPEALSWQPGMVQEWRRTARWHTSTGESNGFRRTDRPAEFDVAGHPVLGEYLRYHLPYYQQLHERRLSPRVDETT
jgi:sulfotransferase family protein